MHPPREVWRYEWLLLQRHPKLAAAAVGLLFAPALLPIQLSDQVFQVLHPCLPLT